MGYLRLQVLDLVKPSNQVIFEVVFDFTCDSLDAVVSLVNFAQVKLALDEGCQLRVVDDAVAGVSWTLALLVGSRKLGLVLELPSAPNSDLPGLVEDTLVACATGQACKLTLHLQQLVFCDPWNGVSKLSADKLSTC